MCDENRKDPIPAGRSTRGLVEDYARETQGQIAREMSDEEKLAEIFTYHQPNPFTGPKFENLRAAAKHFAEVILLNVPRGPDRTCAIRHVRDAVMTANAGVSLNGLSL